MASSPHYPHYRGQELELFALARNWKTYWSSLVRPVLAGSVLEVGAGLGENTELLCDRSTMRWRCLEPDPRLAERLRHRFASLSPACRSSAIEAIEVVESTLPALPDERRYDVVLYIDVLEHIADDRGELAAAAALLQSQGRLVVLAPAHQRLFSPFDAAIGHHRRYSRSSLLETAPSSLPVERSLYLDSVGLLASLANRALLRQELPTRRQILVWDRVMVRLSKALDPLLRWSLGKSILMVWRKPS